MLPEMIYPLPYARRVVSAWFECEVATMLFGITRCTFPGAGPRHAPDVRRAAHDDKVGVVKHGATDFVGADDRRLILLGRAAGDCLRDNPRGTKHRLVDDH